MKDDRTAAIGGGPPDVELELGRLAAAPVPTGLRRRILDRALESRENAVLTPGMRVLAIACSALIVAALVIDPLIIRRETARLAALLGVPGITEPMEQEPDSLWAELGVDTGDIDRILLSRIVASGGKGRESYLKDHLHARGLLKGMIDYENAEGLN